MIGLKPDNKREWSDSGAPAEVKHVADTSDVLMSIDGKPVLTVKEYEQQLDMARQANQQVDMILQMMPNAEKEYIFKGNGSR